MTNVASLLINKVVDGAYIIGLGSEIFLALLLIGFFAYMIVRAHVDRAGLALIGALVIGICVWAGWIEIWIWGIVLLIGGIVFGYALLRMGGETQ